MILITGAAGFIGKNLVLFLQKRKIDFCATDIYDDYFLSDVSYSKLDITDRETVFDLISSLKPDFIIHLSAHPLPASIKDPYINAKVNILGTLNILDAMKEYKVKKIVFTSASSLVGEVQKNPVSEDHPCTPKTPYGVSKYAVEHFLRVYYELYGLNYVVFRLFNVYGPYQYPESGALIPVVMKRILNDEDVYIFGDGSSARDFIFVGDVVSFLVKALENEKVTNVILNLGTGKLTSIKDLIYLVAKVLEKSPKIVYKPARPGEITNFSADVTNLKRYIRELPSTSLDRGLTLTYSWFKKEVI
ncbi:MAG TPA: NAD-dependent epimerase/dehydratase family protein [Candidatus Desulfofervidus auxilii]|uniref:NAD-dependent epimerase/dehydratase family protein n=1 Tax=Desulfofervidus auxilii TaxID=1621989 RepID=A0A7C0Y964_DESA2|nr:NAD-dependent epimerase/dehydratase family protein [Candidatus Desulfofervidus auxilii]